MVIILSTFVAAAAAGAVVDWFLRTYTTLPAIVRMFLTFLALLLVYGGASLTIGTR